MKHALLTMLISALIPALAWAAEPLTRSDVENFKVAIETMQAKSDEFPDIKEQMESFGPEQAMGMMSDLFDDQGRMRVFSVALEQVRSNPEAYQAMRQAAKDSGFASLEQFEAVGNLIFVATIAAQMGPSEIRDMRQFSQIPESQLAMLPENIRPLAKMGAQLAAAAEAVPPGDLQLIRELKPLAQ